MILALITIAAFKWIANGNIEMLILMIGYFIITYLMDIKNDIADISKE
jgi:hypothetical protein